MLSMIGHPSGDEPLMMDVRQSGSGPCQIKSLHGCWPLRPEAHARFGLPPLLLRLTCAAPSVDVLWRPLVSVAVVTRLVTHPPRGAVVGATGLIPPALDGA